MKKFETQFGALLEIRIQEKIKGRHLRLGTQVRTHIEIPEVEQRSHLERILRSHKGVLTSR